MSARYETVEGQVVFFDPIMAETRFGCGLSASVAAPSSVEQMMERLKGQDFAAQAFPIPGFEDLSAEGLAYAELLKDLRRTRKAGGDGREIDRELRLMFRERIRMQIEWTWQALLRCTWSEDGFRERLVEFWFDHFSATGKNREFKKLVFPYMETAIRPHLSGRMENLLTAVVTHPMMLHFLDQSASVGPNSAFAQKRAEKNVLRGLNENLAREILELHTLGVDGPYGQEDVRQLAELLTGLVATPSRRTEFRNARSEPGAETVLGRSYGGDAGAIDDIHAVLRDLARHPSTAAHLSWKLARHFVSDRPDPGLVKAMTGTYLETDGVLAAVYETMLRHDASWGDLGAQGNAKRPFTFVASSMRALGVQAERTREIEPGRARQIVLTPMSLMGQPRETPPGPQGWPEEDAHWVTPQGVAARLQWAMSAPSLLSDPLPDPREFVVQALGPRAPADVVFAAKAAEDRRIGTALVLMSPAFQRH
ncbi:DUF1800 domain-containing protein [Shimia sp. W99]